MNTVNYITPSDGDIYLVNNQTYVNSGGTDFDKIYNNITVDDSLENIFAGANGKLSALLVLPKIKALTKKMDYKAVGGAMMLGVQKPVVKAHGSSDATAFFNAIRQARDCVSGDMIAAMTKFMQQEQVKKA